MARAAASAGPDGWTAWNQLTVQLTGMGATVCLSVIATLIICIIVEKTVGFRLDDQKEMAGLDYSLHGESGYGLIRSDR